MFNHVRFLSYNYFVSRIGGSEDAALITEHSRYDKCSIFFPKQLRSVGFQLLDSFVLILFPITISGSHDRFHYLFSRRYSRVCPQLYEIHILYLYIRSIACIPLRSIIICCFLFLLTANIFIVGRVGNSPKISLTKLVYYFQIA